jgi:hypothetical protein
VLQQVNCQTATSGGDPEPQAAVDRMEPSLVNLHVAVDDAEPPARLAGQRPPTSPPENNRDGIPPVRPVEPMKDIRDEIGKRTGADQHCKTSAG